MLSLFPGILYLAPFSALILRIASGLTLLYISWRMQATRRQIESVRVPFVGHVKDWMIVLAAIVGVATGALLIVGLWTQAAAIVGMLIALKHLSGTRSYAAIMPLSAGTYALLFIMCLCLLITGAGPIAFDLPL